MPKSAGSARGRNNEESPSSEVSSFLRPALHHEALHGLPGLVVETILPHSEADPAGLLLSFLAVFGNRLGAGPHANLGHSPQPGRLFVVLVGDTATGRKGTAGDAIESVLAGVPLTSASQVVTHGIQSAEALIDAVDDRTGSSRNLIVIETEFGRLLATIARRENLADTLNLAFDGKTLRVHSGSPQTLSVHQSHFGEVGVVNVAVQQV
jgi:hypothetical protein